MIAEQIAQLTADLATASMPALKQNVEMATEAIIGKEDRGVFDEQYEYWKTVRRLSKEEIKRRLGE